MQIKLKEMKVQSDGIKYIEQCSTMLYLFDRCSTFISRIFVTCCHLDFLSNYLRFKILYYIFKKFTYTLYIFPLLLLLLLSIA